MARGRPFARCVARLVRGGAVARPAYLASLERHPPSFVASSRRAVPALVYAEDGLRATYLRRNPAARDVPLDLRAASKAAAHVADAFAAVQAARMRAGVSEEEAYAFAEGVVGGGGGEGEEGGGEEGGGDEVFCASLRDALVDIEMRERIGAGEEEEGGGRAG